MRTEIHETGKAGLTGKINRRPLGRPAAGASSALSALQPVAIDAAFEDETMPDLTERILRRDAAEAAVGADEALLSSLSAQLDEIVQQQREIRRLLNIAGRRRLDMPARK